MTFGAVWPRSQTQTCSASGWPTALWYCGMCWGELEAGFSLWVSAELIKATVEGRVGVKGAVHHKAKQIYYAHILIPIPGFLNFSLSSEWRSGCKCQATSVSADASPLFNSLWRELFCENQNYNHIMDQRCWKAEIKWSSDVSLGKWSFSPSWRQMNQELRERVRHTQRRLHAKHVSFITCKFSFWVESFEVSLSSRTDKWDIKGWMHNASRNGKIEPFFFSWVHFWFLTLDRGCAEQRAKLSLKCAVSTAWCCVGLSEEESSDAEEVMSFCFSTGSDWRLFDINRMNVVLKKPPWLNRHGKGSNSKNSSFISLKLRTRRHSVEHLTHHIYRAKTPL